MKLLLDADVLIGALDGNDPHHQRARALFTGWRDADDACAISVVNLTEVLIAPSVDVAKLAATREAIGALGVTVHQRRSRSRLRVCDNVTRSASPMPIAWQLQNTRARRSCHSTKRS